MTRKKGSHRLNPRQWAYLQAIFALDQEQEAARRSWRARWGGPPAAEWRWIPDHTDGAPLWQRLREAGVCDPGTGSTGPHQRRTARRWLVTSLPPVMSSDAVCGAG
ncbi:hypothetical protein [Thermogemmatispora sp.]|uniref:hypothetical protein n=1 Tax=Thermogemmatispora sp. TaxID=1968838 RepID=UPI0035E41F9E